MKATGVIRRLDDLGRIVIPKEIRRNLRIREGTPMEIFTDREGGIILRKYSPIGELSTFAEQYAEVLSQSTGHVVCILDKEQVIAVSGGSKKELLNQPLSYKMEEVIEERSLVVEESKSKNYQKNMQADHLRLLFIRCLNFFVINIFRCVFGESINLFGNLLNFELFIFVAEL